MAIEDRGDEAHTHRMLLKHFLQVDLPNNLKLIVDIITVFEDGGFCDAEVVEATRQLHGCAWNVGFWVMATFVCSFSFLAAIFGEKGPCWYTRRGVSSVAQLLD